MSFASKVKRIALIERLIRILSSFAAAFALLSTLHFGCAVSRDVFLTTASPDSNYVVALSGRKARPSPWSPFSAEVYFEARKNGELFWQRELLHSGDGFDLSFEIGYPDLMWIDERTIRFYNKEDFASAEPQIVKIVNETDGVLSRLRVEIPPTDKFLVFDVPPRGEIQMFASAPKGDYCVINVRSSSGERNDISKLASFKVDRQVVEPFEFIVLFSDSGIEIRSPNLQKYVRREAPGPN